MLITQNGTTLEYLIAATKQLLDEGGVKAVTLREVGKRARVSHNAVYRHFTNRHALLAAVAELDLDDLRLLFTDALAQAAVLPSRNSASRGDICLSSHVDDRHGTGSSSATRTWQWRTVPHSRKRARHSMHSPHSSRRARMPASSHPEIRTNSPL